NPAVMIVAAYQNVGGCRRHDELQRPERDHHQWHACGEAARRLVIPQPARGLIGHAVLENLAGFRRERRLLSETPGLGLVERGLAGKSADYEAFPLAGPIRVLRFVGRACIAGTNRQRCDEEWTEQIPERHCSLRLNSFAALQGSPIVRGSSAQKSG